MDRDMCGVTEREKKTVLYSDLTRLRERVELAHEVADCIERQRDTIEAAIEILSDTLSHVPYVDPELRANAFEAAMRKARDVLFGR